MRPTDTAAERPLPRRRRIGSELRREQILAIAARHFERRPYSEVSTGAIADESGVGRPLIHYYFGTKRELYLEVVRRLALVPPNVPATVVEGIPEDAIEERIRVSIDYWLSVTARHRAMWTSAISIDAGDRDLQEILEQADHVAAHRMLEALCLHDHPQHERLHTLLLAFGGLTRAAGRQWLVHNRLSRDDVFLLLTRTVLTIIRDVLPRLEADDRPL
ncbi:helix-turn-helix domain containing protein [Mycobacterium sp. CVI_P3]|uniref:Helix-turn-helix domain containing protein n=1 Tax=Mycobacterium pinniadriaticum TaxID=2994102 RepID=A0ABT3SC54_9MYCO|nr:TetR/AcrR family transcriptional regulator [Mycobacterium pinniadriaticum]MCX2930672.1 helix-turn-helix domain containing protein [Mycobacterium pinniadriaticum]MCX2937096.1 helix-turn-helix domain containing protein [Mycobacterium pinniadriaticum]